MGDGQRTTAFFVGFQSSDKGAVVKGHFAVFQRSRFQQKEMLKLIRIYYFKAQIDGGVGSCNDLDTVLPYLVYKPKNTVYNSGIRSCIPVYEQITPIITVVILGFE